MTTRTLLSLVIAIAALAVACGDSTGKGSSCADGQLRAVYRDTLNSDLRFAFWADGQPYHLPVDTGGNVGEYASLAVDHLGVSRGPARDLLVRRVFDMAAGVTGNDLFNTL